MRKCLLILIPFLLLCSCENRANSQNSTVSFNSANSIQKKYLISSNIKNGNVIFKLDEKEVKEAKAGDCVNVYLTFLEGYKFKEFANKDINFTEIKKDEIYSFIMPNNNVIIDVITEEKNIVKLTGIKAYSSNITNIEDLIKKIFYENDQISLTFNGLENKEYRFFVNGKEYNVEKIDGKFKGVFQVPNKDFSIEIFEYYISSSTGVQVTFNKDDLNYKVYGIENNKIYEFDGNLVFYIIGNYGVKISGNYILNGAGGLPLSIGVDNMVIIPVKEDTKTININIVANQIGAGNIEFKDDDVDKLKIDISKTNNVFYGDFVSIKVKGLTGYKPISAMITDTNNKEIKSIFIPSDGLLTFTMPEDNVLIDFEIVTPKLLSFSKSDILKSGEFLVNSLSTTSAFPTDDVEFVPTLNDGYLLTDATFYYQEGKSLTKKTDSLGNVRFMFNMPLEGEVNITCEADKYYSINFKGDVKTFSVPNKDLMYKEGQKVSLIINPTEGYQIDSVILNNQELKLENGKYSFDMPNYNVEIIVNTSEIKTVSLVLKKGDGVNLFEAYDNENKKLYDYSSVKVGTKVTLKFSFNVGYEFKNLISNNINVKFVKENDLVYSFIVLEMEDTLNVSLEGQKIVYPAINVIDNSKLFTSFDLSSNTTGRKNSISFPFSEIPTNEKVTIYANAKKDTVDTSTFKVTSSIDNINLKIIGDQGYDNVVMVFSFTMPNNPITLTLDIEKKVEKEKTNDLTLLMDNYNLEYNFDGSNDYVQIDGKFSLNKIIYLHSLLTEEQFKNNSNVNSGYYNFGFQFLRADYNGKMSQVGKLVKITSYNQVSSVKLDYSYFSYSSQKPLTIKIGVFSYTEFK